jgi:6-phosphofructokinase
MKIAILASGGNSPGMNNIIVGLVKAANEHKIES